MWFVKTVTELRAFTRWYYQLAIILNHLAGLNCRFLG